jgi:hypothetical protein
LNDEHGAPTDDATPTLGVRCAWCWTIFREPVDYPNPDNQLTWTHGMCPDCQRRFEGSHKPND